MNTWKRRQKKLMKKPYNDLKSHLKSKYGESVYRVPIDAGFTCPNKNGTLSDKGCIYCDQSGSGFSVNSHLSMKDQMNEKIENLKRRNINSYMAYFQANSNTYAPVEKLESLYRKALEVQGVKVLDISTRPDLVSEDVLTLLERLNKEVDVILELGLQTVNEETLIKINRKHDFSQFIDAVVRAKKHNLEIVVHMITNLPWDSINDVKRGAKYLSALGIDGVKLHSLYIVDGSPMGEGYKKGNIKICSIEEYIERTITFLEYLSPKIVIHRLVADPPIEGTLFGNWGKRKIELINLIEKKMLEENRFQGSKF